MGCRRPTSPSSTPRATAQATGGELDYVLVFGRPTADPETLASPEWQRLEAELAQAYRRVAVADEGSLEVYERLGTAAADRGAARRAGEPSCEAQAGSASASRS